MWNKSKHKNVDFHSSGVIVTLEELIKLRGSNIHHPIQTKKKTHALFSGQFARKRGRGIEFDGTHEYQAGDDIRHMAWRITARSLTPHVKVYHEEKERTVWLAVDLSPSLYFGTRSMFKSVRSIKYAAHLGWAHLQMRERIGAFIATPNEIVSYPPKTREQGFLAILKSLAENSTKQPAFTDENCLHSLIQKMESQIRSGHLVFITSDFNQFDDQAKKLVLHIAARAQVKLIFVYDPLEAIAPPVNQYVLTDGKDTALFNTYQMQSRKKYQQQFEQKIQELTDFTRKHNIAFQILCTDQSQEVSLTP